MKKLSSALRRMCLITLCVILWDNTANATLYTATLLGGNFNTGTTWVGGVAPGATVTSDIVVIPALSTVTLIGNETFTGTSSLTVAGTLASAPGTVLSMTSGTLAGVGAISADSLVLGLLTGFSYTGTMAVNKLTSLGATVTSAATITVNKSLNLVSGMLNMGAGDLIMGNLSTITETGGSIITSATGILSLDSVYNVVYSAVSATAGPELTGLGFGNLTVNVPGTISLAGNTIVNATLSLVAGTLALAGNALTFGPAGNLLPSGTGTITGSTLSNVIVNTTGGLTGALRFATGAGSTLNNLVINTVSGATTLGSSLNVNNLLTLTSGALALAGNTLTLNPTGNITAVTGTLTGSTLSNLVVNTTGGLTSAIPFTAGGNMLNNLVINTVTGATTLGSDLGLSGLLTLTSGALALAGHTLTMNPTGNIAALGTGTLTGSTLSNLVVNTTGGLTNPIPFTAGSNMLNNLVVNTVSGATTLGSALGLSGLLTLTSGTLALAGNTLTMNPTSDLSAAGVGTITGSTLSDLVVNSTSGLSGALRFATGAGNTLNNLVVNTVTGGAALGSALNINNLLTLTSGALSLAGNTLTLNPTGNIAAVAGTITGSPLSNLVVNTTGGLTSAIPFTAGSDMLNNLVVNTVTGATTLASSLSLSGVLTLTSGTLALAGNTLTLNPAADLSALGTGTITGSTLSNLVVNSAAGLTGALRFATGAGDVLNNLVINTTSGATTLGSDLSINNLLTLTAGTLSLAANTLTLNPTSNLSSLGTGTITGSTLSNLVVNTTGGLTGALRFATGIGDVLNNLVINTVSGTTTLASSVNINNLLTLTSGALALASQTLTLNPTGNIAATAGTITGSTLSNIVVNTTGGLTSAIPFTAGSNMLNNLVINTVTGATTLGSDLSLSGILTLTSGALSIASHTLTLNPTGNIAATAGTLTGSTLSNLVVNTTGGLTNPIPFTAGGNMLNNLVVNTVTGATTLSSDLGLSGLLTLTSGTLALAAHTLTMNPTGDLSATGVGTITGSTLSNLVINTTAGLTGALRFATGGGVLNNLVVNTVSGGATLASNLNINNLLTLTSGALSLAGNTLTINPTGNIATTAGTITGSTLSNLVVNTTGGLTGAIPFTTGSNMLNNLVVNTVTGATTLASGLSLSGVLTLTSGTLALAGNTLTLNPAADVSALGTGTITGSTLSNLVVNSTAGLTGVLRFATGAGDVLNNLVVNTTSGATTLGSNLSINNLLTLTAGTLSLAGNTLTMNPTGNLAATGIGTITGSTLSNLVVNTTGGLTGALRFVTGTGDVLNNLVVNTVTGVAMLGSNLNINNLLTLTSGALSLAGHTLTMNPTGNIAATTGTITGSTLSNLVVNTTGGLTSAIPFTTGSSILDSLTLNTITGATTLASDLGLSGLLTLTSGTLALVGHTLTLNPTADVSAIGTGMITGSTLSNLIVNSTAGLTGALRFATGAGDVLNNLVVNTTSGAATLGSDLSINNLLTLTAGTLSLAGNVLTINPTGDLSAAGIGTITGGTLSNLVVNSTSGLTGALRFATGAGDVLNNLVVNTVSGGAALGSALSLNGLLTLTAGTLSLNGQTLTLNPNADLSAAGAGTLTGSALSNLIVNTTFSLTSPLLFATGGNMLNNLTVNMGTESDNIMLGSNLTIQGALALMSGDIKLGTNDLDIATGAVVNGGTANSYVMTDATGALIMSLVAGTTDTFKVGSTANFAPMALTANAGAATGNVSMNIANGVLSNGTTGALLSTTDPMVNVTWFVSSTASSINYNMLAMWSAGMEVNSFNTAAAYVSHYTSGAWDVQTPSAASTIGSMYAMARTGVTSLSPFMVTSKASGEYVPVVNSGETKISIYPNPASVTLNYSTTATVSSIEIVSATGQVVKSANGLSQSVSVSDLAAGTYFIHFHGNDLNTVQQFVKD